MAYQHTQTAPARKYLNLEDMRSLRQVFFSRRRPVDGRYAGRHATTQRGHSAEFSDYRHYMPGDEVGDVDWKVYGRSDKLFIKLFEHESDMNVQLLIDASASMGYKGYNNRDGSSKYDFACRLAAAVAFLTVRQQDRVALGFAQRGLHWFNPAQATFSHLDGLLSQMERTQPAGEGLLHSALKDLASKAARRMLLVVLSDLLEDREQTMKSLSILGQRGAEVVVFHVLHPEELSLPDLDEAIFRDSESGAQVRLNVPDARIGYQRQVREYLESWKTSCAACAMDYRLVTTNLDFRQALSQYLFQRSSIR